MAARHRKRSRAAGSKLLEKGVLAIVIGVAFLAAPLFLGTSPMLRPVAQGLKLPAWFALGIGIVLLIAHRLVQRAKAREFPAVQPAPAVLPGSKDMFPPEVPPAPGAGAREPAPAVAATSASASIPAMPQRWDKQVFELIEWRRFEAVCERLFAQAGFQTRSQSHGADGGVDIWLYSKNSEGPASVVQCKHWLGKPVGVKEVREFLGAMTAQSLKRGTYATSSTFTTEAIAFAKKNGIHLLDGKGLLSLIAKRSDEQQQELLTVACEGEYWRPTCASCGVKMVERTASRDQRPFWGCANYPRCKSTLPVRKAGSARRP